jgi:hypothetical protein
VFHHSSSKTLYTRDAIGRAAAEPKQICTLWRTELQT